MPLEQTAECRKSEDMWRLSPQVGGGGGQHEQRPRGALCLMDSRDSGKDGELGEGKEGG